MQNDITQQITNQPPAEVAAIVHQILGDGATPTGALTVTKIGRSAGIATAGIFRVTGQAHVRDCEMPWSAVVKILGRPEHPVPNMTYNGYNEIEVYRSGVFAKVCGGVRGAHCYAIQPRTNLQLLWLEDLSSMPQPPWQTHHFIVTARHLGQFNAYWPAHALPSWEWLGSPRFRAGFTGNAAFREVFQRLPTVRNHPIMQAYAPGAELAAVLQHWDDCDALLRQAKTDAVGVCHLDCHPRNLFPILRGEGDGAREGYTVAIDWTKVGVANLGIDLGHLLASPLTWLDVTSSEASVLRDQMFNAYVAGLAASGWSGNEDEIRLIYFTRLTCEVIRDTNVLSNAIVNTNWRNVLEQFSGLSILEIAAGHRAAREFFFACKADAQRLALDMAR